MKRAVVPQGGALSRIRTIKPDYQTSGKQLRLSVEASFLNIALWGMADDAGRLKDDDYEIAARCPRFSDPLDDGPRIIELLKELEDQGWIDRYEVLGKRYIQIHDWRDHQVISHPTPSKIPSPPTSPESSGSFQKTPEDSSGIGREGKGKERIGREGSGEGPVELAPPTPPMDKKAAEEKRRKELLAQVPKLKAIEGLQ